MTKILAAMLWLAGIAVIICAAALLSRRLTAARPTAPGAVTSAQALPAGVGDARAAGGQRPGRGVPRLVLACLILIAGSAVIYTVMVLIGLVAVHAGPAIDKPIFHWTAAHRAHKWQMVMRQVTQLGNPYPSVIAAGTGAVCLAVTWRRNRWVPPVMLAALLVVAHVVTLAIDHTVHRAPPPGSNGTFPSGATAAAIAVYGLIAYLLWREFSGERRTAVWAGAAVAGLGFSEGYSRVYLGAHWFTDALAGLLYGCLLLGLFVVAVRVIAGPANTATAAASLAGGDSEAGSATGTRYGKHGIQGPLSPTGRGA